ncbi:MAG: RdgB/HAM1 family non-canonical purine NTP pyrophosphatase [Ignavibacteria bacterium]|nr:RdgB/HAM1 family non-canonical purine NTP pyrophosphatase [Ignavibacteria bacterium]
MKLLMATNNRNKIEEILSKIKEFDLELDLLSISDLTDEKIEIEETGDTLEENALIKAKSCFELFGITSFADDTGLEVFSLNGMPGVHSARFSGVYGDDKANRRKLLSLLQGKSCDARKARFRTVVCLYDGKEPKFFEGVCYGKIIEEERGDKGFGYDSIFVPDGYEVTFAQMDLAEKNAISHRGKAIYNFLMYLKTLKKLE